MARAVWRDERWETEGWAMEVVPLMGGGFAWTTQVYDGREYWPHDMRTEAGSTRSLDGAKRAAKRGLHLLRFGRQLALAFGGDDA